MKLFVTLWLCASVAFGGVVVQYDPSSFPITNRVTRILTSENTLVWLGQSNRLINPTIPAGTDFQVSNGVVRAFVQADYDRIAATNAILIAIINTNRLIFERTNAIAAFNAKDERGRVQRAILELITSEINILRVNAGLPIRTTNQLNNAISNALVNAAN